jgi:hypothetical protein
VKAEQGLSKQRGWQRQAGRRKDLMSALHLIVPVFLGIQFVLTLVAVVSSLLFAGPEA